MIFGGLYYKIGHNFSFLRLDDLIIKLINHGDC